VLAGTGVDLTVETLVSDGSEDMTEGSAVQPTSVAGPPETARTEPPQAAQAGTKGALKAGQRLAWLDVLRGLAALAVVFNHFGYFVPSHVQKFVYQWIDPGQYGVFVFFIISGYIIPASLERRGSVRSFWVSRVFRLYPLYLLAVGLAVLLWATHFGGDLRGEGSDPATSVLSQLLMMSNVLGGKNLPNVVWSLSYEMIFYLLLTALFLARIHRPSNRYALIFGVAAVAVGGVLPQAYFNHSLSSPRLIAAVADVVVLGGLALAVVMRGMPRMLGAVLAAILDWRCSPSTAPGWRRGRRCRSWRSCSPGRCCTAQNRGSTHGAMPSPAQSSSWDWSSRPASGIATPRVCPRPPRTPWSGAGS
jgi:hypothetical protein